MIGMLIVTGLTSVGYLVTVLSASAAFAEDGIGANATLPVPPKIFWNIWVTDLATESGEPIAQLRPRSKYVVLLDLATHSYKDVAPDKPYLSGEMQSLKEYLSFQMNAESTLQTGLSWAGPNGEQRVHGKLLLDLTRLSTPLASLGLEKLKHPSVADEQSPFLVGRDLFMLETDDQEGILELKVMLGTQNTLEPQWLVKLEACVATPQDLADACQGFPRELHTLTGGGSANESLGKTLGTTVRRKVFYATDRAPGDAKELYGTLYSDHLQLGVADVDVNEAPSILDTLEDFIVRRENGRTLLTVKPTTPSNFYSELKSELAHSKKGHILVFLHGYRVPFPEALRQTARMANSLKFIDVPILYSWPSKGTFWGYMSDADSIQNTVPHLKYFLKQLLSKAPSETIHLMAHSMGSRPLLRALQELDMEGFGKEKAPFQNVILAAPDLERGTFLQVLPSVKRKASNVTLYASSQDHALQLSKWFNGNPRAGDAGPSLIVSSLLETIDATGLDTSWLGHSYHRIRRVVDDLFYLLSQNLPAESRAGLQALTNQEGTYYSFSPN